MNPTDPAVPASGTSDLAFEPGPAVPEPESGLPPQAPARRGPWSFLAAALPGGASSAGLQLIAAWEAFALLSGTLWAVHLGRLVGWSSLPDYWGELLTARDLWELLDNGGLRAHWSGPWVPLAAGAALGWSLWAGWRMQMRTLHLPARLGPWIRGGADALLIGAVPLSLLAWLASWGLDALGGLGLPWLGWLDWLGGILVRMLWASALMLQWWLCRLDRALVSDGRAPGPGGHLRRSLRGFWGHAGSWCGLLAAGVLLRAGLAFLGLFLGWRLGGGTLPRVVGFLALQAVGVAVNAWLIGWFLRLAALYSGQESSCPGQP